MPTKYSISLKKIIDEFHLGELYLPDAEIVKSGVVNVGSILFLSLCIVLIFLNLLLV